jgi:hypothetical protein
MQRHSVSPAGVCHRQSDGSLVVATSDEFAGEKGDFRVGDRDARELHFLQVARTPLMEASPKLFECFSRIQTGHHARVLVCGIPISSQTAQELLRLLARDERAARDGTAFCFASALVNGRAAVALTPEMSSTLAGALERERRSGFRSLALAARRHSGTRIDRTAAPTGRPASRLDAFQGRIGGGNCDWSRIHAATARLSSSLRERPLRRAMMSSASITCGSRWHAASFRP